MSEDKIRAKIEKRIAELNNSINQLMYDIRYYSYKIDKLEGNTSIVTPIQVKLMMNEIHTARDAINDNLNQIRELKQLLEEDNNA